MLAASNDHKKLLKIRPSTKYAEIYRDLRKVFLEARSKGHRVDFNWIWSKARILYRQKTNDPNAIVRKYVIVNLIKRNDLRLRSRQRNRKLSKENFRLPMQQWHATTRERLIRTGCADSYNSKWGRYAPEQRFNVDQSPCPFVINTKKTYEMLEKKNPNNREHKVWISQPGSGLDKRQCTLQICFRPTGKQPRVAIIFNGKGKRKSEDEKNAWHPDVDVYFQENAWANTAFSVEWVKRALSPIVQHSIDRFVLFFDNLSAQESYEFKKSVSDLNGVCWYGLPNATDIWQPVDAGYAELLKVFLNQKHHEGLKPMTIPPSGMKGRKVLAGKSGGFYLLIG